MKGFWVFLFGVSVTLSCPAIAEDWHLLKPDRPNGAWLYDVDFLFVDSKSGLVLAEYALAGALDFGPQSSWSGGSSPAMIEAIDCKSKRLRYAGLNFGSGPSWSVGWRSKAAVAPDDDIQSKLVEIVCLQLPLIPAGDAGG